MAARHTICISHATGAQGVEVARLVAGRLGLRYVDDDVISEAAEWADLDPSFVADAERRKPFVGRLLGNVGRQPPPRLSAGGTGRALPSDADLRALISSAVSSFAREGNVVIVAHAASFAVGGGDGLRVLVTGSPSVRAGRLAADRGIPGREAEQVLRDEDAGRADYLRRFYGVDQELPAHYDLVLNTDRLTPDDAAAVVGAAATL